MKPDKQIIKEIHDELAQHGLRTLCEFINNLDDHRDELESIRTLYHIDILNPMVVKNLSDEQIELLKRYEAYISTSEIMAKDEMFGLVKNIILFACIFLVMCFAYIVGLTWIPIPKENVRFADTTLGFILGTLITTLMAFVFSNSHSLGIFRNDRRQSDKKETQTPPPPPTPPRRKKCPLIKEEAEEEAYASEE